MRVASLVSLALAMVGCSVDFLTGAAYSPLIFYIPAVIYAAWFASQRTGWICVIAIAISVLIVNSIWLTSTEDKWVAHFNATTRIATIGLVYWVVRRLRDKASVLEELNQRLRRVNLEKDKLLGIISHDLRSPFNAVLAYAELIEQNMHEEHSVQARRYARACRDAARNAYELLENLLRWAQLQIKRTGLSPAVFEVSALIDRCTETHRAAADLKKIEIVREPVDPNLTCFADFATTETVLRNLLNNAVKFTPSGGRITVGAHVEGGVVRFSVSDTGIGMAKDRLDRLFTLAAEPASSGTQGERGIGLGLVLCKELVERNGGQIAAESESGHGSRFSFILPRLQPK